MYFAYVLFRMCSLGKHLALWQLSPSLAAVQAREPPINLEYENGQKELWQRLAEYLLLGIQLRNIYKYFT